MHLEHGKKGGREIPVHRMPLPIMKQGFRNVVHDKPNLRAPFGVMLSMQWCFFVGVKLFIINRTPNGVIEKLQNDLLQT